MNGFLESIKGKGEQFPYKVELYRGETVEKLYGKIEQPEMDKNIKDAFLSGDANTYKSDALLINIYPIKADIKCIRCHTNANAKDVLGVLKIEQDTTAAIKEANKKMILYFMLLSPIPFLMAGAVATYINRRIASSTKLFHEKVKEINTVKDLTKLEVQSDLRNSILF